MTKKGKLFSTLAFVLVVAILIPVAIFAVGQQNLALQGALSYSIRHIRGQFAYSLTGNKSPEGNVGYNAESKLISPVGLFSTAFEPDEQNPSMGRYVVRDSRGAEVTEGTPINVADVEGGLFFEGVPNSTICYYFVFINTASADDDIEENHNVIVKPKSKALNTTQIVDRWDYFIATTNADVEPFLDANISWLPVELEAAIAGEFSASIPPKSGDLFSYIILRYSMTLVDIETGDAYANIKLSVSLESPLHNNEY